MEQVGYYLFQGLRRADMLRQDTVTALGQAYASNMNVAVVRVPVFTIPVAIVLVQCFCVTFTVSFPLTGVLCRGPSPHPHPSVLPHHSSPQHGDAGTTGVPKREA